MFIGREKELVLLQQDYIGKAVMVYGKRRVGKTTLIQKALDNCPYQTVYFECLKGTVQENIDSLVDELVRAKILPVALSFSTLQDVFTYLNTLPQKMVVVIDEYPYLKVMNEPTTVDSVFQSIIDNRLGNIELILSGSHIGMMKDLLQEKNALYGRFAVTIKLNELNYLDTAKFYPDKTPYDKVAHYAVFGGSPFVNQALRPTATLRENIVSTILNPVSAVYLYASQLLLSDYSVKINAERIFAVIGNGKKRYSEIEDKLDVKKTGNLAKQMKPLRDLEIISRNYPINKLNDSKKSTFEINDNLLRFYFTFIYKNASALQVLGAEAFYDEYVAPTLTDFISRRFEGICRDYFSLQVRSGKLKGVRNIGSYYYDDPVHRKNGEFDVALELADGYAIYEAKYYAQPMTLDEIHREAQQVANIKELAVKQLGFIAINGFVEQEKPYTYLDGNDILRECSPKQAVDASPLQFNLFSHKSRSFSKRFTHGKATYSLSALKQCKELIRKNRWSTRLKAEHNSRCAEVNVLFASCQKLLNYVMFQPDLSPAYDYQQMVLSKSCTKNNSTISFVFATRPVRVKVVGFRFLDDK